jgi:predicted acylesterase/phospholipase RssA
VTTKVAIGSALGALVVGAVVGTAALVRPREVVTPAPVAVVVRMDAGASVAAVQVDPEPAVAPVQTPVVPVAVTPTPAQPPKHVAPPMPVVEKPANQPPAPPQHEDAELALLQRAMSASQRGDAQAALATALEHASTYPNSALAQEREVIAIEALVTLGRPAEAKARVAEFRAKWPTSSHLLRIEQLVSP